MVYSDLLVYGILVELGGLVLETDTDNMFNIKHGMEHIKNSDVIKK